LNSKKASHISVASALGLILTIALFSLLCAALLISVVNDIYAFVKNDSEITVSVENGSSVSDFSRLLADNGIIKNPHIFKLYALSKDKKDLIEGFSGEITLNQSFSYRQILNALKSNQT